MGKGGRGGGEGRERVFGEGAGKGGGGWVVYLGDGRRRETSLGRGDKGALHGGNDNWVR